METGPKDLAAKNLFILTTVNSVWAVVFGLIGPFYVIYVEKLSGGMEKLGFAFAIMVLSRSLTAYLAGFFSDKIGRKPFLILTGYINAVILFIYTIIDETYQLYLLQSILGITDGVADTIQTSFLGDLTVKGKRGKAVGKFNAVVGLASAAGLLLGGFVAKIYGIRFLFYFAAVVVATSAFMLIFIREEKR